MSIPKQIMEADAEADEALEAMETARKNAAQVQTGDGQPAPKPTEPEAKPEPVQTQAKAGAVTSQLGSSNGNGDLAALQAETQRLRSMMGRLTKEHERMAEITRQNEELRNENQSLREEMDALRAEKPQTASTPVTEDLVTRLREKLGDGYDEDQIKDFAAAVREVVNDATGGMRKRFDNYEQSMAENAKAEFINAIRREYPGFLELDNGGDARLNEFYATPISPVSGETFGDVAKKASMTLDYPSLAKVIDVFAAQYGLRFSTKGMTSSQQTGVRPESAHARPRSTAPVVFPRSEVERFRNDVFAKRASFKYGLTAKQIEERLDAYEKAEEDGRIDENR